MENEEANFTPWITSSLIECTRLLCSYAKCLVSWKDIARYKWDPTIINSIHSLHRIVTSASFKVGVNWLNWMQNLVFGGASFLAQMGFLVYGGASGWKDTMHLARREQQRLQEKLPVFIKNSIFWSCQVKYCEFSPAVCLACDEASDHCSNCNQSHSTLLSLNQDFDILAVPWLFWQILFRHISGAILWQNGSTMLGSVAGRRGQTWTFPLPRIFPSISSLQNRRLTGRHLPV